MHTKVKMCSIQIYENKGGCGGGTNLTACSGIQISTPEMIGIAFDLRNLEKDRWDADMFLPPACGVW